MLGKKLQHIRKTLKLSQEEFASEIGISYRAYTSYEREDRKPSLEFLASIARKYDVNLNWFLADIGEVFQIRQEEYANIRHIVMQDVRKMLKEEGVLAN